MARNYYRRKKSFHFEGTFNFYVIKIKIYTKYIWHCFVRKNYFTLQAFS